MPTTIPTERVDFRSSGTRCAAWLTLPPGPGPHPAVVLVHGLGATHDMMLPQYEQHFAAAGIATLAFDYRNTGASDGQPRQHISNRAQRDDVTAALAHLKARPEIDPERIGLWGTSIGGMNVVRVRGHARPRGGRGGAVPDRSRPGCGAPVGPADLAEVGARNRAGRTASGDTTRPPICADRRTAGEPGDGHHRRCRSRVEVDGAAGRPTTGSRPPMPLRW
jgi:fermentation-respiration switch protein FrsA (DUF1100 family)